MPSTISATASISKCRPGGSRSPFLEQADARTTASRAFALPAPRSLFVYSDLIRRQQPPRALRISCGVRVAPDAAASGGGARRRAPGGAARPFPQPCPVDHPPEKVALSSSPPERFGGGTPRILEAKLLARRTGGDRRAGSPHRPWPPAPSPWSLGVVGRRGYPPGRTGVALERSRPLRLAPGRGDDRGRLYSAPTERARSTTRLRTAPEVATAPGPRRNPGA